MKNLILIIFSLSAVFSVSGRADIHSDIDNCDVTSDPHCLRNILHQLAGGGGGGNLAVVCASTGSEWEIKRISDGKIITNWGYGAESKCKSAAAAARQGAVCGQSGGSIYIYSILTGKQIAEGGSLSLCLEETRNAISDTVCGFYGGGKYRFKISTGEVLGGC